MFSREEKSFMAGEWNARSPEYQQFSISSLVCVALRCGRQDGYAIAFAPRYPSQLVHVQRWHESRIRKQMACGKSLIYAGHDADITSIAWSPDQRTIASTCEDRTLQVWDSVNGKQLFCFQGLSGVARTIAWSPDGKRLAIGCDSNLVECFSLETRRKLFTLKGHKEGHYGIDALAWSPDGSRIASAGDDNTVRIWYAASGQQLCVYRGHAENWVRALAWSPDGRLMASAGDDIQIWNTVTGQCLLTYTEHARSVDWIDYLAWTPDGCALSSIGTNGELRLWDASTGETIGVYHQHMKNDRDITEFAHAVVWTSVCTGYTIYKDCAALAVAAKL
jgi:WD40 repeat protein